MSMSEFEESPQISGPEIFCLPNMEGMFPDDFSADEVEFACELDAMFSLEDEILPPLFVQTLVESEAARFRPVENSFELKTRAYVFRRLQLKRSLFRPLRRTVWSTLAEGIPAVSRPLAAFCASCILIVLFIAIAAAPAFASGLTYLLSGAHSGVLIVTNIPHVSSVKSTHSVEAAEVDPQQISVDEAQRRLHFAFSTPSYIPSRYTQGDLYIYDGNSSWVDGPIMVVEYTYALPGVAPKHITICEFKPRQMVYLVVKDGSAKPILVKHGKNSNTAVFVEGHWTPQTGDSPYTWVSNDRSEIVDENNGVVFWVVGDPSDGIYHAELMSIANSLHVYDHRSDLSIGGHLDRVNESDEETPRLFANDVISLDDPDNPDGPSFKVFGSISDQPQSRNVLNGQYPFTH